MVGSAMLLHAHITDTVTGETRVHHWVESDPGIVSFDWGDNNNSCDCNRSLHFSRQGSVVYEALFTIAGTGVLFSDSGDSGSLITALDAAGQRTAVGIVVGGMNDGTAVGNKVTLALAIEPIIVAFGVTLVGGHNV